MSLDIAPEDQDKLAQLFGGKLGMNSADAFAAAAQKVSPQAPPAPSIPGMPTATSSMITPPAAAASDDPTLLAQPQRTSPMPGTQPTPPAPPMPKVPSFQQPPLQTMQDLSGKIAAASQPVRRQDYQPHWWEKLLSVPVAAAEGFGDASQGMKAGSDILNRRYNMAVENQKKTVSPLEAEFDRQSKIEPYLRDTNENAQRTFEDTHQNYDSFSRTQDRQEATEERRDNHTQQDQTRQDETNRKQQEDESTPAPGATPHPVYKGGKLSYEIQTKAGGTMPYTLKSIDEGALLNDPTATRLFNTEHNKEKGDGGKASAAQSRLIETKKQTDLEKAEGEYVKDLKVADETLPSDRSKASPAMLEQHRQARDEAFENLSKKKQEIQNAYEAEIEASGGSATHVNVGGGTPAQPAAAGQPAPAAGSAPKVKVGDFGNVKGVGRVQITKVMDNGKFEYKKAPK